MIMYNAQHTCFHILLLLLTVVHSGDADTSTFDAASHNHESYMMGTTFYLYSYCVCFLFLLSDVLPFGAALQNKRREIPP